MYDARNEPHEFVGEDREAAMEKACAFFGLDADQLLAKELSGGEVYGLGGRTVVVAVPRDRAPTVRSERERGGEGRSSGRERGGRERRGREGRGRGRGAEAPVAVAPLPEGPSLGTAQGELGEIGSFVLGAIERLDIGPFELRETADGANVVVEVRGAAAEVLSRGEARAIDALQLIANQVLARREDDGQGRVVLEVEGASESREKHLERLAERVVKRAREGGRAVALDPMNGRDRRIIHITVREQEGVATMSIGEGRFRQVVVVPEGAPEYAEALRQSEGSSER